MLFVYIPQGNLYLSSTNLNPNIRAGRCFGESGDLSHVSLGHFYSFPVDISSQPMFTPALSLARGEILACTRPISEVVHSLAVLLGSNTVLALDNFNMPIEDQHNRLVDSRDVISKSI